MKKTKARQVRVYLHEHELELLTAFADATRRKETAALSVLCAAGLEALQDEGFQFVTPLTFSVSTPKGKAAR